MRSGCHGLHPALMLCMALKCLNLLAYAIFLGRLKQRRSTRAAPLPLPDTKLCVTACKLWVTIQMAIFAFMRRASAVADDMCLSGDDAAPFDASELGSGAYGFHSSGKHSAKMLACYIAAWWRLAQAQKSRLRMPMGLPSVTTRGGAKPTRHVTRRCSIGWPRVVRCRSMR